MKTILIIIALLIGLSSCTKTIDKEVNGKYLEEVEKTVNEMYNAKKAEYINDQLTTVAGFYFMALIVNPNGEIPTFKQEINKYSLAYDEKREEFIKDSTNNSLLDQFCELTFIGLVKRSTIGNDFYIDLSFNNLFNKKVKYIIVKSKCINDYDVQYWNDTHKIIIDDTIIKVSPNYNIFRPVNKYVEMGETNEERNNYLLKYTTITVNYIKFADGTDITRK